MHYLDLFTGAGAGSIAVGNVFGEEAKCLGFSEVDRTALKTYQRHFPTHPLLGDVRGVNFKAFRGKTTLAFGGSPCQNLSIAKAKREGLKGSKSILFWEYVRMLKEAKPEYYFLENVASMSDEDRDIISEELGCMPVMIDSATVTGQSRERYYWANFPIRQPENWGIHVSDVLEKLTPARAKDYLVTEFPCIDVVGEYGFYRRAGPDKVPHSKLPFVRLKRQGKKFYSFNFPQGNKVRLQVGDVVVWSKSGRGDDIHEERMTRADKSNTLTTGEGCGSQSGRTWVLLPGGKFRMLTELETERLQGYPDNWTEGAARGGRYRMMGNSFTVPVIEWIMMELKRTMEAK